MNNGKFLYFLVQHRALYLKKYVLFIFAGGIIALLYKTHYFCIADSDVTSNNTRTHTQKQRMHVVFPLQEWSPKRATILRCVYLAYLVINIAVEYSTK